MEKEQIIFDINVKYEDAIEGIIKYQEEINRAKKDQELFKSELAKGIITKKEYARSIIESNAVIAKGKDSIRTLTREVKNNIAIENEMTGSIKSLQAELSNLYATYDRLSKADRESKLGVSLLSKISETRIELIKAEEASGRFQRNVGSYKLLGRDMVSTLQQVNPALGTMINRLQNSNVYAQTLGKTTEWLTKTFKLSAASAMTLQLALTGLVAGGIYLLIKAYERWNKEQEKAREIQNRFTDELKISYAGIGKHIITIKNLHKEWDKLGASFKDKEKFIKNNKDRFDELGVSVNNVKDAENLLILNTDNFIKSLQLKAKATAGYELASKSYEEQLKKEHEAEIELRSDPTLMDKWNAQVSQFNAGFNKLFKPFGAIQSSWDVAEGFRAQRAEALIKEGKEAGKTGDAYFKMATQFSQAQKKIEDGIGLFGNNNKDPLSSNIENTSIELQRLYEKTMDDLIEESEEKRRAVINRQYENQVEDLKKKHGKDKDSQELLNKTILALTAKRDQDLQALEQDSIKKRAEIIEKDIANQLEVIKKHSDEELALKVKSIEVQRSKELAEAEKLGLDLVAINKKYDDQIIEAENELEKYRNEQSKLAFQNRIAEARLRGENTLAMEIELKEKELATIRQMEDESDEDFFNRKMEMMIDLDEKRKELRDQQIADTDLTLSAYASMFGGMSELLSEFAEQGSALSEFAKALALVEIGINTAKAISAGIASSQGVMFPGNLVAMATTITAVMSNITQAKKILSSQKSPKAPKFATGGLVSGPGSGTSDNIPAHLSNGESVMTALATQMFSPMLSAFNQIGGGVPITPQTSVDVSIGEDVLARAFAKGALMLPPQSVSVQEINSVSNRVDVLENSRVL